MKISTEWLQTFFEKPLPDAETVADALTFHAFEIESVENGILDVKVTPNRGHDCLCHRGIAKEIAAILDLPIKNDALRQRIELGPKTDAVSVTIQDAVLCPRYIAGIVRSVKVGPSPDWLQKHLASIGQRPINNIVDATNFVMFNLGQPLHAFDAHKLKEKDGAYAIGVRLAKSGEKILALDEKKYELTDTMLVITDAHGDTPIGIAGVKGGMPASITEDTVDIIIESANFNGPSVRKTAQALRLRTDASTRYEQEISPWLAVFGMKAVVELIEKTAGGEVVGFSSDYALAPEKRRVSASLEKINRILGSNLTGKEVADALRRLDLSHIEKADTFDVHVPFERLDLNIEEDIVEEVGRIHGYDKVKPEELPPLQHSPQVNPDFYAAERAREDLIAKGYSEVFTSVFAEKGERVVANKVDGVKPYLRTSLVAGLTDALERNRRMKDILGLKDVKLFEIGAVWKKGKETIMLGIADEKGVREEVLESKLASEYEDMPLSSAERYQPFSKYPYIVRDIAMWVPKETTEEEVLDIIRKNAGELLVKSSIFDRFEKGERVSLAFRLVFQSFDRTLTDFDANERMASVSKTLTEKGFEIR
ncbi:phenylalanine--tRNA ligase subunit beta [Candidatus Parcubacteria bacterium]|nr:MAG: phenylalanine--tRNA ligase subunit beta [Candidatus Parcubacteria bacterium]